VIATAADAFALVASHFRNRPQESAIVLLLDGAYRPAGLVEVALGSITSVEIDVRVVLGAALTSGVTDFVLAHGHPSGDPYPSPEDVTLTNQLAQMAASLGLHLADHLIIAGQAHFSFLESGLLPPDP
jgi:DNA repair protein RadC